MTRKEVNLRAWQRGIRRGAGLKRPGDGALLRVMAVTDGYAMVRRPGCAPFVLLLADIVEWNLFTGDTE